MQQIKLPYINTKAHIGEIMRRYDDFAGKYNAIIQRKREEVPEAASDFQTLKPTHRAIFKDIVFELSRNMQKDIRNHEEIQTEQANDGLLKLLNIRNPLCGDGFFVCHTNRYQLAKHSTKEESTIYRNILRLIEAGVIKTKVGHGKKADFELHIHSHFLLVSDRANPEYNPLAESKTESAQFAFCKVERILLEQLENTLYSAYAVDKVNLPCENQDNTTSERQLQQPATSTQGQIGVENQALPDNPNKGNIEQEQEGWSNAVPSQPMGQKRVKPTGGRGDIARMEEERGIELAKIVGKNVNPQLWHSWRRLSSAAHFVDYAIDKIYTRRGITIYPEARIRAIEYAERFYFPNPFIREESTIFKPCQTWEEYANRLMQLEWCIDTAHRYAAKHKGYFVILGKYIDIENPTGLTKTFSWWMNSKLNEADKKRARRNLKELQMLLEQIDKVLKNQDYNTYKSAETFIKNHIPKYQSLFRKNLGTTINKLENK